jgi:hypothetical protein
MPNNIQLQLRRATKAEWILNNTILADGEVGIETDTSSFKIGNGINTWNDVPYSGGSGYSGPTGNTGMTGPPGIAVNTGATGPTGLPGVNGVSSGVVFYLDTFNGTNGVLLSIPDNGSQIVINSGIQPANNAYKVGTFSVQPNSINSVYILGGMWSLNLFANSTNVHLTLVGIVRNVQVIPSVDEAAVVEVESVDPAIATHVLFPKVNACHSATAGIVLKFQVMPSVDLAAVVVLVAIATNALLP